MAERAFGRIGYFDEQGNFNPADLRARDVFASNGKSAEEHITNAEIHLTTEQIALIAGAIQQSMLGQASGVATLGADGKIPASQLDLGKYVTSVNVETYADMLALTASELKIGEYVFVSDATGDDMVDEGWAAYRRIATNGNADDFKKVAEGESLDINIPELEQGITEAKTAAQNAATAASTADGKAVAAQTAATNAQNTADAAQTAADNAATQAAKRDSAFCTNETDMASKNLRAGALVVMAVDNN